MLSWRYGISCRKCFKEDLLKNIVECYWYGCILVLMVTFCYGMVYS
jgi:hypothetical protein